MSHGTHIQGVMSHASMSHVTHFHQRHFLMHRRTEGHATHMHESWHTRRMGHVMNESWHTRRMGHVMNESWHTRRMSHVMNESWHTRIMRHTHEWVMARTSTSASSWCAAAVSHPATLFNACVLRHVMSHIWVMSHTWVMSHIWVIPHNDLRIIEERHTMLHVTQKKRDTRVLPYVYRLAEIRLD